MKLVSLIPPILSLTTDAVRYNHPRQGLSAGMEHARGGPAYRAVKAAAGGERVPLVMYIDGGSGSSAAAIEEEFNKLADAGVSMIVMAFYMTGSSAFPQNMADLVLTWSTLASTDRQRILDGLHSRGCKLLISAGGATEGGNWYTHDPAEYGNTFCSMAADMQVDGVDLDLEGLARMDASVSQWLHKNAVACRAAFPGAIITSAPQSPYFDPAQGGGSRGHGWGDLLIDGAQDGGMHDHFLIQYYNQGSYYSTNTYEDLFTNPSKAYSIKSLMRTYPNAPPDMFYVGKPFMSYDGASADWVDYSQLHDYACKARTELGWTGGLMFWQHHWGSDPYDNYRTLSAPCSGAPPAPITTTTTTTRRTTTTRAPVTTTTTRAPTTTTTRATTTKPSTTRPKPTTRPTVAPTTPKPKPNPTTTTTKRPITRPTVAPTVAPTPTPSDDPMVNECQQAIEGTQLTWTNDCQSKCALYGPGGPMNAFCPTVSNGDELVACVAKNTPSCVAKPNPPPSGDISGDCKTHITSYPVWEDNCKAMCDLYGPGGALGAFCQDEADGEALAACVVKQVSYCQTL